jgi:hypothetical protein
LAYLALGGYHISRARLCFYVLFSCWARFLRVFKLWMGLFKIVKAPGPSFNVKGSFLQAFHGEGHVGASNFRPSRARSQHFMIRICRVTARMERYQVLTNIISCPCTFLGSWQRFTTTCRLFPPWPSPLAFLIYGSLSFFLSHLAYEWVNWFKFQISYIKLLCQRWGK